jgi:hypothetical protein
MVDIKRGDRDIVLRRSRVEVCSGLVENVA